MAAEKEPAETRLIAVDDAQIGGLPFNLNQSGFDGRAMISYHFRSYRSLRERVAWLAPSIAPIARRSTIDPARLPVAYAS